MDFNFLVITGLALVNSVNPCQIAMLVLVLVTILMENELTQTQGRNKKVLLVGLAFIAAVYLTYLFYGIVLVQLFQASATFLKNGAIYFKDAFAILAMIIGALQLKDFFFYKKGSFGTEMPLWMRPKAKRIIEKITSPSGAFFMGFIITLFLGPCTMAPLLVASESLSQLGLLAALPWLLYFNFIIILPLIIITIIIYSGFKTTDDIANWKERNVRWLHLIAGILLLAIGLVMLIGWL